MKCDNCRKGDTLRKFRKILPGKYREIKFEKEGTVLCQKSAWGRYTNIDVNARLGKDNGSWVGVGWGGGYLKKDMRR